MFTVAAIVAAMSYLVLALLVGALVTSAFLLDGDEPQVLRRRLAGMVLALVCAFLAVHLIALIVQGAKLSGGHWPAPSLLTRYAWRTQSGQIWLLRALYGVIFLLLTVRWLRRGAGTLGLLLFSLPLAASRSLSGHAIAVRDNTFLVVAADSIHLIATACWAGGLPFLVYLLMADFAAAKPYPKMAALAVKRFSRLAGLSVAMLLATGAYQTWTHVGRLDALTSTTYGNILILKLSLFACMLVFGGINFLFTRVALLRHSAASLPQSFRTTAVRRVGAESLLGVAIIILTGFLTGLAPAAHSDHAKAVAASGASQGPKIHKDNRHGARAAPAEFKPADGARVKIVSPRPGANVQGGSGADPVQPHPAERQSLPCARLCR